VGSRRFERQPEIKGGKNILEFDSSPDRALAKAFGWEEGSTELRLTESRERVEIFDVYARDHSKEGSDPKPLTKRGVLRCLTAAEIRRRQDQYLPMSPAKFA